MTTHELAEALRQATVVADMAWTYYDELPEDTEFAALTQALVLARNASAEVDELSRLYHASEHLDGEAWENNDW